MNQATYNAKVQEMQRMFAETRVRANYDKERLSSVVFEVYWNGQWHTLGVEYSPMTSDVRREWWDVREYKLRAQFADALTTS